MFPMQKLQKNMSLLQANFIILKQNAFVFGSFKKKEASREGNLPREFHFITAFGLLQPGLRSYLWKQTRDVKF